jgi:hypothetical protein
MTSSPWPGARGRGGAAGAVSNRAHPNAAFKTLRRRALSCRRPQDVDRTVSLARSEQWLVLPSSSPGCRPSLPCKRSAWIAAILKKATLQLAPLRACVRSTSDRSIFCVRARLAPGGYHRVGRPTVLCPVSGARAHKHRRSELRSTGLAASGYCGARTAPVPCARRHAPCQRRPKRPTAAWA